MTPISRTKLRKFLFLALILAGASAGLGGCYTHNGKWAPFCNSRGGCDRDNGSGGGRSSGGGGYS
jgi:hypothetical protein